ncbi:peptidase inhibitor family I36 protein [Frankia tisae]|uniref:peptidase inhibitor family I36 protein n=1 Tax=Frankia tisae TaxID=2950104 RepID=UPI0021BF2498|nr:peptidase inhibitor family I36 protein [Frankia tisae]
MNRTSLRRGLALAVGGVAAAGIVAAGQPALAAGGGGSSTTAGTSVPAPVASFGLSTASTKSKSGRNDVGGSTAHIDGVCNLYRTGDGDLCLWYFQKYRGSHADFYISDNNLNNNTFNSPGTGQGSRVGNNSESAWNYDQYLTARVYTGVNSTGTWGIISPSSGGNFTSTFINNVESFIWT